jgi:type IV pilus assembly protein PilC
MKLADSQVLTTCAVAPAAPALPPALRALAAEGAPRRWSKSLRRLSAHLEGGETWEAALRSRDVRLPPHLRGIIQAGVRSQTLRDSLVRLVDLERRSAQLHREMWVTLAYPLTLLTVLVALFFGYEFVFISDLMQFYRDVYNEFHMAPTLLMDLPTLTMLAVYLSRPEVLLTIAAVLGAFGLAFAVRMLFRPRQLDALFNRFPILGPLAHWSALANFCRLLALLLEAGIPLPQALGMTAAGVRNGEVADGCWQLSAAVQAGQSLAGAMRPLDAFPHSLEPLVHWGEARSALPEALLSAGEMFEGRVRVHLSFVRTFMPPFVFLIVAAAILCFVLAALWPMFDLLNQLV